MELVAYWHAMIQSSCKRLAKTNLSCMMRGTCCVCVSTTMGGARLSSCWPCLGPRQMAHLSWQLQLQGLQLKRWPGQSHHSMCRRRRLCTGCTGSDKQVKKGCKSWPNSANLGDVWVDEHCHRCRPERRWPPWQSLLLPGRAPGDHKSQPQHRLWTGSGSASLLDMCTASGGGPLGQHSLVFSLASMSSPLTLIPAPLLLWLRRILSAVCYLSPCGTGKPVTPDVGCTF